MDKQGWVLLANVATEMEADIILGLLEGEGVPAWKDYPGIGDLKPSFGLLNGVDIYVPEDCSQTAQEILKGENIEQLANELTE